MTFHSSSSSLLCLHRLRLLHMAKGLEREKESLFLPFPLLPQVGRRRLGFVRLSGFCTNEKRPLEKKCAKSSFSFAKNKKGIEFCNKFGGPHLQEH